MWQDPIVKETVRLTCNFGSMSEVYEHNGNAQKAKSFINQCVRFAVDNCGGCPDCSEDPIEISSTVMSNLSSTDPSKVTESFLSIIPSQNARGICRHPIFKMEIVIDHVHCIKSDSKVATFLKEKDEILKRGSYFEIYTF